MVRLQTAVPAALVVAVQVCVPATKTMGLPETPLPAWVSCASIRNCNINSDPDRAESASGLAVRAVVRLVQVMVAVATRVMKRAVIVSLPAFAPLKQNWAVPLALVVAAPVAGLTPETLKSSGISGSAIPAESLGVAVTQCCSSVCFVAERGVIVSVVTTG